MRIELSENPDEADYTTLFNALDAFSDEASGRPDPIGKLALLIRDDAGRLTGGLWAVTYYGWMFIQLFYLPAELRRSGLGSRLLRQAEEVAQTRGCLGVWLDTFSFQARPFYERHGYTVFGRIDDYPPGGARYFLAKRLDGGAALAEKAAK